MKNFIQGTLIVSTIIFLVCSVGFWFAGLKAPVFFGLFCAITNIIPYIGPYIGAAPAVIVGYATSPLVGTVVLIICVAIQFIEGNFIQPLVMSKTMKLHPVTIIVGLLIFGYFFGIVGMIVSTPLMSIIKIILTFINENMILLVFLMIDGGFEMNENDVILGYTIDNFNSQRELLINYTNQIIERKKKW